MMVNNRIHIIVATTLSALLLWVSVNLSYDYHIGIAIPIVVENLPQGKAFANPLPKTLQIRFRGTGWRCAALLLGRTPRLIVDIASIPQNKRGLVLADVVERVALPPGIIVTDMKPDSLLVGLDTYTEKRIPVVFKGDVEFRGGYGRVGDVVVIPDSVTIGGAAGLLSGVAVWPTARLSFTDVRSSIDTRIPLADYASQYFTLSPSSVRMKMDVQQLAEKTLVGLPVDTYGVPANREVILIPPKITLIVRGGVQQLATLDIDSFRASLDYAKLNADSSGYSTPRIDLPKDVQVVGMKPERMQFIIRTKL